MSSTSADDITKEDIVHRIQEFLDSIHSDDDVVNKAEELLDEVFNMGPDESCVMECVLDLVKEIEKVIGKDAAGNNTSSGGETTKGQVSNKLVTEFISQMKPMFEKHLSDPAIQKLDAECEAHSEGEKSGDGDKASMVKLFSSLLEFRDNEVCPSFSGDMMGDLIAQVNGVLQELAKRAGEGLDVPDMD